MSTTRGVGTTSAETTGAIVVAPKSSALKINSIEELERLGKIIAQSNLFGLAAKGDSPETVAAKGVVVAGLCQQEGMSFMEFMRRYHFVNGKAEMRTDAMLAEFQRLGGAYTIQQSDSEGAVATFSYRGTTFKEKVIWQELCACPEPPFFEQIGPDKWRVRDNYLYPRKRSQMLWARCVSNGIRKVCPLVNMGVYTPEETVEFEPSCQPQTAIPVAAEPAPAVPATPAVPVAPVAEAPAPVEEAAPAASAKRRATRKAKAVEDAEVVEAAPAAPAGNAPAIAFPADAATDPEKYAVCPCEGKMKGVRWDAAPTETLQGIIAAYDDPNTDRAIFTGMTNEHADYIRALIAMRAEQESK